MPCPLLSAEELGEYKVGFQRGKVLELQHLLNEDNVYPSMRVSSCLQNTPRDGLGTEQMQTYSKLLGR